MRDLIASKPLVYNSRRLKPGEGFMVRSLKDARVLVALRKATYAPDSSEPAGLATEGGGSEIEDLRKAYLEQKGDEPDKRWGTARLKRELGIED